MVSPQPPSRRGRRRRPRPVTKWTYYWRRAIAVAILATIGVFGYYGVTLYQALHNPAYGVSSMARIAEWGRNEGIGGLVTWAENIYNSLHPAKVGGNPNANAFGGGGSGPTKTAPGALPLPPRLVSPAPTPTRAKASGTR